MAVTSTLVVHFPSVLLLFHTVTYLITLFCLCLRSGQRQECNNEEIFRVSVVSHITRSHLSAVAAAQLCLYGQVYLMGWGSSAGGLGNMSAVGIFWIQQKFGQSKPLLVTPELLYFNTSVLQKSWKLLGKQHFMGQEKGEKMLPIPLHASKILSTVYRICECCL